MNKYNRAFVKNKISYYYDSARLQLRFCMKHGQLEVIPEKFQMIMLKCQRVNFRQLGISDISSQKWFDAFDA